MSRSSRRIATYIGILLALVTATWLLISLADADGYLGSLGPNMALNWLGILITVFSLSVTFFLAVMAIEAFSHMNFLRDATDRYEVLIGRLEADEQRFETSRKALDNYNTEMLTLVDFYIQKIDLSDEEKLEFSQKFQISRARLELTSATLSDETSFDDLIGHVLVLAEHGRVSDLTFALDALRDLNAPRQTHEIAGEIIRKLKTLQQAAPYHGHGTNGQSN